jgi:hypothetical protein
MTETVHERITLVMLMGEKGSKNTKYCMGGTVSVHCVEMIDHCAMPSVITQNSG